MKFVAVAMAALAALCLQGDAKTFSRCELVRELRRQGFAESKMRDWVCLVEHESSRRTDVIGPANTDGSHDHGLFQINDRYWCNDGSVRGKGCHATCAELRTDDISKASMCAKKIFQIHGFIAWYGWRDYCKGKPLPDISDC